jgi:diguanylate cyclase (GGDEF)-like protein/PAS domain S-box-containing protein
VYTDALSAEGTDVGHDQPAASAGADAPQADSPPAAFSSCVDAVRGLLEDMLAARPLSPLPENECHPDALPLVQAANRMVGHVNEIAGFLLPLAKGELSVPAPSPDNHMAAPFRELHARLNQLTWQAHEIARGDYSQRIDFLGEFSEAFNQMVELLAARERDLKAEILRRREAEAELEHERDLLVAGPLVTFRWGIDDEGTVSYVSPNISAFGYEAEAFTGGALLYSDIVHPEDLATIVEEGNAKSRAGLEGWTHEYRLIDAHGDTRWVRDSTHAVRDAQGQILCYEGYVIDITAEKVAEAALRRREEQLRVLSLVDPLTGLYNRRGLLALGEHLLRTARRHRTGVVAVSLDVRGLAAINERFGHQTGDDALRAVADVLRRSLRESDVLARPGGDDFVVLLEDERPAADELVRRLTRRLAALDAGGGRPYRLALRIGVAFWEPARPTPLQELLDRAAAGREPDGGA